MCGIAGLISDRLSPVEHERRLRAMQTRLRHRGPDDAGLLLPEPNAPVRCGLAHTRLSILDLSAAGHQPMLSEDGRYALVFNGEIYNFAALRADLEAEGERFTSQSDTEVILRFYARHGREVVRELEGMFAFAIWDRREGACFLARDPLGIKPLYLWRDGGTVGFASELRALLGAGIAPAEICPEALRGYLLLGSVPETATLVRGIEMLPAGHTMLWRAGQEKVRKFWEPRFPSDTLPPEEAVPEARAALEDSVRRHFVSDVPVGIFLSGGLDSTALVAMARRIGHERVETFCISFDEPALNEGDLAGRTAAHFGTRHHDWRLGPGEGRELLAQFLERLDQPSIDGFNTFCVSRLAHEHGSKVVLSGLGGDEVFGGYPSFRKVPRLVRVHRALGALGPLRSWIGEAIAQHGPETRHRRLGAFLAGPSSAAGAYWAMRGTFTPRDVQHLLGVTAPSLGHAAEWAAITSHVPTQPTPEDVVSHLEITRYMRNQLLRDSDVMSMAWGLELRVPFVDRTLLDALARIPADQRLARGKRLLVEAVPEIPEWIARQPKRGFIFPFERWIAAEWREVFERIEARFGRQAQNWYQKWALFVLEHWCHQHGLGSPLAREA